MSKDLVDMHVYDQHPDLVVLTVRLKSMRRLDSKLTDNIERVKTMLEALHSKPCQVSLTVTQEPAKTI